MRSDIFEDHTMLSAYLIRWDREIAKPLLEWHRMVLEAKLSSDQITALFGDIETKMAGEKTMVGKGIDVAGKGASMVSKILPSGITAKIHDLIKDTKKVRNFDAAYDRAVRKLRTAMGGKDSKIVKYVQWLGKKAKAHPIIGGASIGLIIAATALATGGVTAGIVAAFLKTGMELLKGERLSKSIASGIGTGLVGLLLGMSVRTLGQWLSSFEINSQTIAGYADLRKIQLIQETNGAMQINIDTYMTPQVYSKVSKLMDVASKAFGDEDYQRATEIYQNLQMMFKDPGYMDAIDKVAQNNQELIRSAKDGATKLAKIFNNIASGIQGVTSTGIRRSRQSTNEGIQLTEADIKGIANSILGWAKNKASSTYKNVTQKHTVEKLSTSWKKIGSPTDSNAIYALLRDAGIPTDVLSMAYKENKIPLPRKASTPRSKTTIITVNTGDAELDKNINDIIATKGKDAAIAYVQALKAKEMASSTAGIQMDEPITVGKEKISPNDPRYPALKKALSQKNTEESVNLEPFGKPRVDPLIGGKKSVIEYATGGASAAGGVASVANPFGFTISRTPNLFGYIPAPKKHKKRKPKRSRSKSR